MGKSKVIFKPATMELAKQFYGSDQPIKSFKGYVAMIDDRVIGVAGLFYDGNYIVLFSDMKDEFRKYKKSIAKSLIKINEYIRKFDHPIYAVAKTDESLSEKILLKMGFIYQCESAGGKVFLRRP